MGPKVLGINLVFYSNINKVKNTLFTENENVPFWGVSAVLVPDQQHLFLTNCNCSIKKLSLTA